jgi:hypothetical protein
MLEPTAFHEHITNKQQCFGQSDDNDFTMCLDDEVSTIGNADKHYNFLSNKSSKLDLGQFHNRPHSSSRRDFQFGTDMKKCTSNSYLRSSINPGTAC